MLISDWSSDVCLSDLVPHYRLAEAIGELDRDLGIDAASDGPEVVAVSHRLAILLPGLLVTGHRHAMAPHHREVFGQQAPFLDFGNLGRQHSVHMIRDIERPAAAL